MKKENVDAKDTPSPSPLKKKKKKRKKKDQQGPIQKLHPFVYGDIDEELIKKQQYEQNEVQ